MLCVSCCVCSHCVLDMHAAVFSCVDVMPIAAGFSLVPNREL